MSEHELTVTVTIELSKAEDGKRASRDEIIDALHDTFGGGSIDIDVSNASGEDTTYEIGSVSVYEAPKPAKKAKATAS